MKDPEVGRVDPALVNHAPSGHGPTGFDPARWRSLNEDTSWQDGRDLVLLAYDMEVQARFCPGEWHEHHEGHEYDGAVWSCFDDKLQIEIEELSPDAAEWWHGQATHWRDLTPRPCDSGRLPEGEDPKGLSAEQARTAAQPHRPASISQSERVSRLEKALKEIEAIERPSDINPHVRRRKAMRALLQIKEIARAALNQGADNGR